MIYVPIAAIGACCAVLAYFVLDHLWPKPVAAAESTIETTEPQWLR